MSADPSSGTIAGDPARLPISSGEAPTVAERVRTLAEHARAAARSLAPLPLAARNDALTAIADALDAHHEQILAANAHDLQLADALVATGDLTPANRARLPLNPHKISEMSAQVRAVRDLPDPLGRILDAMELDHGLELEKRSVPLGVLAVIFEARPDAVTQIAALALKSGNAVILKPGREVEHTAQALVALIRTAITTVPVTDSAGPAPSSTESATNTNSSTLPADAVQLILGREAVAELLTLSSLVDLVIPRGSRALVEHIQATTRIPVLGHADGICHVYIDQHADLDQALAILDDSKTDYPAVCNAAETALIHAAIAPTFLPALAQRLAAKGVTLLGDQPVRDLLAHAPETVISTAASNLKFVISTAAKRSGETRFSAITNPHIGPVQDWHTEYGDLTLALRIVPSLSAAIDHIHRYGSAHTETICTTDPAAAERFLNEVDAASVLLNASTRFADGFRFGLGAEVGVSTSRIHARGPVGLEGLTTTKYIVRGHGHLVADYRGPDARPFTHIRKRSS